MRLKRRLESDLKVTSRGFAWQPELSEPVGQPLFVLNRFFFLVDLRGALQPFGQFRQAPVLLLRKEVSNLFFKTELQNLTII